MKAASREDEKRLLNEIGVLADRVSGLRRANAVRNDAEIKLLTGDLKAKWNEIRKLRAEPATGDISWQSRRGSRD